MWIDMPAPPIDSVAPDIVAAPLDLNGDGVPELEVHAINHLCHSNANCPTWIYGRVGGRDQRLLNPWNIAWLEEASHHPRCVRSGSMTPVMPCFTDRRRAPCRCEGQRKGPKYGH